MFRSDACDSHLAVGFVFQRFWGNHSCFSCCFCPCFVLLQNSEILKEHSILNNLKIFELHIWNLDLIGFETTYKFVLNLENLIISVFGIYTDPNRIFLGHSFPENIHSFHSFTLQQVNRCCCVLCAVQCVLFSVVWFWCTSRYVWARQTEAHLYAGGV